MILMGERRPEQGHDPIAQHLIHRPLVPVHGGHHPLQHRVEELACFFGIAVGQQLHGALEVGEEYGDLLALAFEGGFRCQDFLDEVGWRVCLG
jgi:hypothetical protein